MLRESHHGRGQVFQQTHAEEAKKSALIENIMAFKFDWPKFSAEFLADARTTLDSALNKGPKPPIIADRIVVEDLNMGTIVSRLLTR